MDRKFHTTHWSLVLAAGEKSSEADEALATLCETYWFPLYAFARRMGFGADEASDVVQSYFVEFLQKDFASQADPAAGRFRSFLLASLKNFISKEREKAHAFKRRADLARLHVSFDGAERMYAGAAGDGADPERLYDRRWAMIVVDRAVARLAKEQEESGKSEQFRVLRGYITGADDGVPYARAARELGTSAGAVKVAVHRLRRRLGALLRAEVTQTTADSADVDAELRYLLDVLGG